MSVQDNTFSVTRATILYVSLSGLNTLQQEQGRGTTAGIIGRCLSKIDEIVKLYGGKVDKFIGESAIAIFLPESGELYDAASAIKAIAEIQNIIQFWHQCEELPIGIGLKAGVESGSVFRGEITTAQGSQPNYFGEAIHLAAHICGTAAHGQVLVGEEAWNETKGNYRYNIMEPLPVKGLRDPIPLFELIPRMDTSNTEDIPVGRVIHSSMVGRDREFLMVEELIKQLLNGRGAVLLLEGAAGVGKSRLIQEIRASETVKQLTLLEGRALSEGKNLSFHPIIQILKGWADIAEADKQDVALHKLSLFISRTAGEQAVEIMPFVATLMGLPLEKEDRERLSDIKREALESLILKNTRDLVSYAAGAKPILILIEDIHWADQSTIVFLESLVRLVRNQRLLFVLIFRPGFRETGERIKRYLAESLPVHSKCITLNTLAEQDSSQLICNLLKNTTLPNDIRELIIQRSEGNPFFIEEVIRSFIDEGLIEVNDQEFRATDAIRFANIPETIDKVILSRIERLDEKTRSLLRTASVIGRNFYFKVLEEAAHTIEELDSRLDYLKNAQLLSEEKHKEDVEFLFKHALAQQATYDSIMHNTRKELHLKIAKSIEKVFADNIHAFYGILAMHFSKAEVSEKVDEYLVKAGDEAFRSGASNEALNFYSEALKRLEAEKEKEDFAERYLDLEIKTAFAHQAAGNNIEATDLFNRIIPKFYGTYIPANPFLFRIYGLLNMAVFLFKLYNPSPFFKKLPDKKFETYSRVLSQWGEALSTLNPKRFFYESFRYQRHLADYNIRYSSHSLSLFTECANLFMWTGTSLKVSQKMLDLAKTYGVENQADSLLNYRFTKKMQDFHSGRLENETDFDIIFRTGMQVGEFWPVTIFTVYCGYVFIEKGDREGLMQMLHRLQEIADSFENSHARSQMHRLNVLGYLRFRHLDKLLEQTGEAIDCTQKTGHFTALLIIWSAKAIAHSLRNELPAAKAAFAEAEKLIPDKKIIPMYYAHYLQARAYIELAELAQTEESQLSFGQKADKLKLTLRRLRKLSRSLATSAVETWRLWGSMQFITGKYRKALRSYSRSIEVGQQMGSNLELSRTYLEVGKFLLNPKSKSNSLLGISGNEYLLKAKAMMEELDLQWDLASYHSYLDS